MPRHLRGRSILRVWLCPDRVLGCDQCATASSEGGRKVLSSRHRRQQRTPLPRPVSIPCTSLSPRFP